MTRCPPAAPTSGPCPSHGRPRSVGARVAWGVLIAGVVSLGGIRPAASGSLPDPGSPLRASVSESDSAEPDAAGDQFGRSVAVDGDTAVIGAPRQVNASGVRTGSAYVFVRSGTEWIEQAELVVSNTFEAAQYGRWVDVAGDTAVVAAPFNDTPAGEDAGSVYVFVRTGDAWTLQAELAPADAAPRALFGLSAAVEGDTVLVGSPRHDSVAGNTGAAYLFTRSGTAWAQTVELTSPEPSEGDRFGKTLDLSGPAALVGSPFHDTANGIDAGSAYEYEPVGGVWAYCKLSAPDGADADLFGKALSLDGDTAVVGTPFHDTPAGVDAGSAYAFVRTADVCPLQAELQAPDAAPEDGFGRSVGIDGDTGVFSAYLDDLPGIHNAGSAYVFVRSGTSWAMQEKVTAPDAGAGDEFGFRVVVDADTIVVGSPFHDAGGQDAGTAYVFVRSGGDWSLQAAITSPHTGS